MSLFSPPVHRVVYVHVDHDGRGARTATRLARSPLFLYPFFAGSGGSQHVARGGVAAAAAVGSPLFICPSRWSRPGRGAAVAALMAVVRWHPPVAEPGVSARALQTRAKAAGWRPRVWGADVGAGGRGGTEPRGRAPAGWARHRPEGCRLPRAPPRRRPGAGGTRSASSIPVHDVDVRTADAWPRVSVAARQPTRAGWCACPFGQPTSPRTAAAG